MNASAAPPDVTVMIPTFQRPGELARALRSVADQAQLAELACEVVVVDNAPDDLSGGGAAARVIDQVRAALPVPLRLVREPRAGVANARNAGVAVARGGHVAFLDDDQVAAPGWLGALHAAHAGLGADVTFGPVRGRAPDAPPALRPLLESFFSRADLGATGLLPGPSGGGCGNAMMRRTTTLAGPEPFDPAANETGGEDDRLFQRLHALGARFAWAAEAMVDEIAPHERSTLAYALRRSFAYGQGPTRQRLRLSPPDRLGAARWMAVGAAQAGAHGAAALVLGALGRSAWRRRAVDAAAGLGKLLPGAPVAFYGAAAIRRGRASAPAAAISIVE